MSEAPPQERDSKETARLEAFSDGVFAIAITLLALNLKFPSLAEEKLPHGLAEDLLKQWPTYLAFVTSFFTILVMWVNHHGLFKLLRRADSSLLYANGFLLMVVTAVPFPTSLLADYLVGPAASLACGLYAGYFVMVSVAYQILWWTAAWNRRLLHHAISPELVRGINARYLSGPPLYLMAAGVAWLNPLASIVICCALWIFWAWVGWGSYGK